MAPPALALLLALALTVCASAEPLNGSDLSDAFDAHVLRRLAAELEAEEQLESHSAASAPADELAGELVGAPRELQGCPWLLVGSASSGVDAASDCLPLLLTPATSTTRVGAAWRASEVDVAASSVRFRFTFQVRSPGGSPAAAGHGLAFVLQRSSGAALGAGEGGLGYAAIASSAAVAFDARSSDSGARFTYGLVLGGSVPQAQAVDVTDSLPFNSVGGIEATVSYDRHAQSVETCLLGLAGAEAGVRSCATHSVDLPAALGCAPGGASCLAFYGFTGATDALRAEHVIVAAAVSRFSPTPAASVLPGGVDAPTQFSVVSTTGSSSASATDSASSSAAGTASSSADFQLMSLEEVAALHANHSRARELQMASAGTVLTVGACTSAPGAGARRGRSPPARARVHARLSW